MAIKCNEQGTDNMRAIFYDLKKMFDNVVYNLSSKVAQICTLIQLSTESKLFYTMERKSRTKISGDFVIFNKTNNEQQSFGNGNLLRFFDLNEAEFIVGNQVEYLFIIESDAALGRIQNDLFQVIPKSKIITSGTPDIFTRLIMCKFVNETPLLKTGICFDGDKGGFDMVHLVQFGSSSRYTYMNKFLTIPKIKHVFVRGFQTSTLCNDLNHVERQNLVNYLHSFPSSVCNKHFIDDILLFLIRNKQCSATFRFSDLSDKMTYIKDFFDKCSVQSHNLTI